MFFLTNIIFFLTNIIIFLTQQYIIFAEIKKGGLMVLGNVIVGDIGYVNDDDA